VDVIGQRPINVGHLTLPRHTIGKLPISRSREALGRISAAASHCCRARAHTRGGHNSRRRRRGRHRCRHRHGHSRRLLRRGRARRARSCSPAGAASAAAAAATPPSAVAAALTHRAWVLRERTRPPRPQRIQCQHDPPFEISKWTSPTGPPEPDSGQLPRNCDIMAVRGQVPVNAAPALTYLFNHDCAFADRTGDEDVATSSNFTERCGQPRRIFPQSKKRRGTAA